MRQRRRSGACQRHCGHEDSGDLHSGYLDAGGEASVCELGVHGLRPEAGPVFGRERLELEAEDLCYRLARVRSHLVDADRPSELARDRRERRVLEAAGGDPLRERSGIEVDVQRVPVRA